MTKLISIVVPVYNEEQSLPEIYRRLHIFFDSTSGRYDFELIAVDDGSSDGSGRVLSELGLKDHRVKYLGFSKNFGKEIAVSAGIHHAKGEAIIILDADLQHPTDLIGEFLSRWEGGAEVVIGVREKSNGSWLNKAGSAGFYWIMNLIGETRVIPNATDFRLIDKKVADEFRKLSEHNRMTRGLLDWLGFKRELVFFKHAERVGGRSHYGFLRRVKLALSAFIAHSLFPLKLAGYLGVIITFLSGLLGAFIITEQFIFSDPWRLAFSGPAMLAVLIVFLIGIVLSCLGLVALYIANIHEEVINRPMYVIRKKINFEN